MPNKIVQAESEPLRRAHRLAAPFDGNGSACEASYAQLCLSIHKLVKRNTYFSNVRFLIGKSFFFVGNYLVYCRYLLIKFMVELIFRTVKIEFDFGKRWPFNHPFAGKSYKSIGYFHWCHCLLIHTTLPINFSKEWDRAHHALPMLPFTEGRSHLVINSNKLF